MVRPATTREAQDVDVYWRTDASARGNLCEVCSCSDRPDGVWLLAGQYFVVVAPDAEHVDTGSACNTLTYRRRAWCRAEIFSCWARNGTKSMYESTRQGLRSLATRCGRRAAAGAAAHLVGAARAQVVPPDEQHARRGLSAHIAPAAR